MRINAWNNAFYNALQAFNSGELFRQLGTFCILVAFAIAMSVYALYLNQMVQIRWRRWLTRRYLGAWLADHAYYQLQLRDTTDNPDQRIAEDLNQFTAYLLSLSFGLLTSVVSLVSFLVILWGLSGPAEIPIGKWGTVHIPAYLVWTALFYAGVGTWLTVKIGRPLVPLNVARQRFEADFRFSLLTQRLSGFERQLLAIHQSKRAPQQINIRREGIGVAVKEIDLDLPDGTSLLRGVASVVLGSAH